jgi:hypothetical protein
MARRVRSLGSAANDAVDGAHSAVGLHLVLFLCSCLAAVPSSRPALLDAPRARGVKAGRRAGLASRSRTAKPRLDGPEHGAALVNKIGYFLAMSVLLLAGPNAWAHCDTIDGRWPKRCARRWKRATCILSCPMLPPRPNKNCKRCSVKHARCVSSVPMLARWRTRLHRPGEGAPYTGLKPAGQDFGPVIPAAEHAIESRDLSRQKLMEESSML